MANIGVTIANGTQILVYSILVANISATNDTVSCAININGSNISYLAYLLPVMSGSSVEIIQRPKVMSYGDLLELNTGIAGSCNAIITWKVLPDLTYVEAGLNISTAFTLTDLYVSTASTNTVITSILATNLDGVNNYTLDILWTDGSNNARAYLVKSYIIPAQGSVEICEMVKLIPTGHKIRVASNGVNKINVYLSGKNN